MHSAIIIDAATAASKHNNVYHNIRCTLIRCPAPCNFIRSSFCKLKLLPPQAAPDPLPPEIGLTILPYIPDSSLYAPQILLIYCHPTHPAGRKVFFSLSLYSPYLYHIFPHNLLCAHINFIIYHNSIF